MAKKGASSVGLYGLGILIMLVNFIGTSIATATGDANTTLLNNTLTAGFVTGLGIFGLAVLLDILGYAIPRIKDIIKNFG